MTAKRDVGAMSSH